MALPDYTEFYLALPCIYRVLLGLIGLYRVFTEFFVAAPMLCPADTCGSVVEPDEASASVYLVLPSFPSEP